MSDDGDHEAFIEAWLQRAARDATTERLLELFEGGLGVLWSRTSTTLGEVTLTAIAERVLWNAAERYPFLAPLKVDPSHGVECRGLRERAAELRAHELREAASFVFVEYLTVLGNLTAEILTPDLHEQLSRMVP